MQKSLHFDESGETFSVIISLENVSPQIKADTVYTLLKTIFERLTKELDLDESGVD
jgi:hypothetical protein